MDKLILTPIKKDHFMVVNDYLFYHKFGGQTLPNPYIVPKGFVTNGFSVPTLFKSIVSATDKGIEIAVVHDFLYSKSCHFDMPRRDADFIFSEGLRSLNVETWKAKAMYIAVVLFGGKKWRKK